MFNFQNFQGPLQKFQDFPGLGSKFSNSRFSRTNAYPDTKHYTSIVGLYQYTNRHAHVIECMWENMFNDLRSAHISLLSKHEHMTHFHQFSFYNRVIIKQIKCKYIHSFGLINHKECCYVTSVTCPRIGRFKIMNELLIGTFHLVFIKKIWPQILLTAWRMETLTLGSRIFMLFILSNRRYLYCIAIFFLHNPYGEL